jgi:hypothetical protein
MTYQCDRRRFLVVRVGRRIVPSWCECGPNLHGFKPVVRAIETRYGARQDLPIAEAPAEITVSCERSMSPR